MRAQSETEVLRVVDLRFLLMANRRDTLIIKVCVFFIYGN